MNTFRAAIVLSLGLTTQAAAFDMTAMTDAERAALRAEIRSYLIENPEVMLEVQTALEAQQSLAQRSADAAMIAVNADAILNDGFSFVGGNPDGSLTVVEFIDYRCGYCKKAHGEVAELVRSDGDIRYVVKEFPILGEQSVLAARFAIAALNVAGPEAYKAVNAGFYDSFRGDVTPETLAAFAAVLGLDGQAILAAMDDPAVTTVIEQNRLLAQQLQISGTPTFVLGDTMLRGYLPLADMQAIVSEVRG